MSSTRVMLLSLAALLGLWGCKGGDSTVPTGAAPQGAVAGAHWTIAASTDADGRLVTEVTPAAGYTINVEYPWRLTVGERSQRADDAEVFNDRRARFVSDAPPAGADRSGELRFSVCNSSTCLTPRETIHWD